VPRIFYSAVSSLLFSVCSSSLLSSVCSRAAVWRRVTVIHATTMEGRGYEETSGQEDMARQIPLSLAHEESTSVRDCVTDE
jgi:hypothetical protein